MQDETEGVILGKCHLDVKGLFDTLQMVDFPVDGAISLEYEENPEDPIDDTWQCVAVAKAAMAQPKSTFPGKPCALKRMADERD